MRLTILPGADKTQWTKRFALWPTVMTDGETMVWLECYEIRWGQKYDSSGTRQWLLRAAGSGQEYPVKVSQIKPPKPKPKWTGSAI